MAKVKVKWRVSAEATGPYRSFERRAWPSADYADGSAAAHVMSADEYVPSLVKEGKHAPLTVRVADHSVKPWQWRKMKGEFATLAAAKEAFDALLVSHPELVPVPEKKEGV